MKKLQEINDFDKTGHEWKFDLAGKKYFLTSPGVSVDDKIYRSKTSPIRKFRFIGGGMHLHDNLIKPYHVLFCFETSKHYIISGEDF
jgi:hypothetical protein